MENMKYKGKMRDWTTEGAVFYRPSGVWKTWVANTLFKSPDALYFTPTKGNTWWHVYNGQEFIVFDEWNRAGMDLALINQYIGTSNPIKVNIKGGEIPFLGKPCLFTTNRLPHTWYNFKYTPEFALLRRIESYFIFYEFEKQLDGTGIASIIMCRNYPTFLYHVKKLKEADLNKYSKI